MNFNTEREDNKNFEIAYKNLQFNLIENLLNTEEISWILLLNSLKFFLNELNKNMIDYDKNDLIKCIKTILEKNLIKNEDINELFDNYFLCGNLEIMDLLFPYLNHRYYFANNKRKMNCQIEYEDLFLFKKSKI